MNRRSWVVLGAVLLFSGLLAYTLLGGRSDPGEETLTPEAFWQEDQNRVVRVEVEQGDGTRLVLERSTWEPEAVPYRLPDRFRGRASEPFRRFMPPGPDTEWWVVEPVRFPADPSKVASLLFTLREPRPLQQVAGEDSGARGEAFGLNPPEATVRLAVEREQGEAVVRELQVGDPTPLRSSTGDPQSYYVAAPGQEGIHTLPAYPIEILFEGVEGFRMLQFARFEPTDAVAVRLLWDEEPAVELVRNGDGWRLDGPAEAPADGSEVQNLLNDLDLLRAEAVTDESPSDQELAAYGLENPRGEVLIWLSPDGRAPGAGEDVPAGNGPPRAQVVWVGDFLSDGSGVYARLAADPTVYRVRGERLQSFFEVTADPAHLAQRGLLPEGWQGGEDGTLQRITWRSGDERAVAQRDEEGAWSGAGAPQELLQAIGSFRAAEAVAVGPEAEREAGWTPGDPLPEGAQQLTLEPEPGSQPSAPVVVTRLPGEDRGQVRLLWTSGKDRVLLRADSQDWQELNAPW